MKRVIACISAAAVAVALSLAGATSANAADPWEPGDIGDPNGVATYVPGPSFIDDCGTARDMILVGNKDKLNWWVYKNANGTNTATVYPKPGYFVPAEKWAYDQGVFDFPAFKSTCIWVSNIPAPVKNADGTFTFARVTGIQWVRWAVSGGTKVVAQPKIGYGIASGTQSVWILP